MKRYIKSNLDWYGSALGFTEEEINAVYHISAMLQNTISQNIPGAEYDPISYKHGPNGVLCVGEINYNGDVIDLEFSPGRGMGEGVRNFMNAWLAAIGSDLIVDSISDIDEAINIIAAQ